MPSPRVFIQEFRTRLIIIRHGCRWIDRFHLLLFAVVRSTPRSLREKNRRVDQLQRTLENSIAEKTILRVFGLTYNILDSDSLRIIVPECEDWIWKFFRPKEGDVVIDVGANIGKYTCVMARRVESKGLVVAIEPHPTNFAVLTRNIRNNDLRNVRALNIAAYDKNEEIPLFLSESSGTHGTREDMGFGSIMVSAKKLDDVLLTELGVRRVDWMKIDVEGAEYQVLEGMTEIVKLFKPRLLLEVSGATVGRDTQLLESLGYSITLIKGSECVTSTGSSMYLFCC